MTTGHGDPAESRSSRPYRLLTFQFVLLTDAGVMTSGMGGHSLSSEVPSILFDEY